MTEIMETPAGPKRSRAVHRLLFRLFLSAAEDRSLRHLIGWNMATARPQDRRPVERDGEHYIAKNLREYRHIWLAAAAVACSRSHGGGQDIIHAWHLPPLPEGLLYGSTTP